MSKIIREGFAQFCKRQQAGLLVVGEIRKQEQKDKEALLDAQEKRFERKYNLFYENLDLIMRHKDEIIETPRYANIDAHYLLEGGGLYVGRLATSRQVNIAGTLITFNLKLGTLLKIWEIGQFRIACRCGETAVIRRFVGTPLSGGSSASAICPKCKMEIYVKHRSFGKYFFFASEKLNEDIEMVVKSLIAKWTIAEAEHHKKYAEGYCKDPKIANELKDDGEICDLETLLQELWQKELEEATKA
ncbi:MAG: hypothetical protein IKS02_03200 [Fibrobacter sp.]|nr:hypothetical protein [Fibrobacter sp.]